MRLLLALASALALAAPASAAKQPARREPELVPAKENWSALQMEAKALMGELKYQHGDLSGARATFRDSLDSSRQMTDPHDSVVGLDLFRTAELAAREGDFETARRHLDILMNRYPDSEWARRGRDLMEMLPTARPAGMTGAAPTPVVIDEGPESMLSRVRAALLADRGEEALAATREFLRAHPRRPEAEEAKLLSAALQLRRGDPARAVQLLKPLAAQARSPEIRDKAVYLLGAALVGAGDASAAAEAVPAAKAGASRWLVLAQAWRGAAAERAAGRGAGSPFFRRVLEARLGSPLEPYLLGALARDLESRGKPREAAETLARAAREAQRWGNEDLAAAAQLSRGHMLYRAKLLEPAASAYAEFLAGRPDHPQRTLALYQRGLCLKRLGRRDEAVRAFEELASSHPDSVYASDAHLQLGQLLAASGAAEQAISHYKAMGKSSGEAGAKESLLLTAQVHYNAKRFKEAAALYQEFLDSSPSDPRAGEVEELLLNAYWLGDRDNPALLDAVERYKRRAVSSTILWGLAARALEKGDAALAADLFGRHAARHPKGPRAAEALWRRARALEKLGRLEEAAAADRAVLARFPRDPHAAKARWSLAAGLEARGFWDDGAKAYAELAHSRDPREASEALLRQAQLLLKGDRKPAALSVLESLLTRFPSHGRAAWAWHEVGVLREALGRPGPAALAYAKVPKGDPNRARALYALARCRERLKDRRGAASAYEALAAEKPAGDPVRLRGLLRLGLLRELEGKAAKAMPLYSEVLRLAQKGSPDFEAARKRLESLSARRRPAAPAVGIQ